jgi:hypothetical protein
MGVYGAIRGVLFSLVLFSSLHSRFGDFFYFLFFLFSVLVIVLAATGPAMQAGSAVQAGSSRRGRIPQPATPQPHIGGLVIVVTVTTVTVTLRDNT